MFFSFQRRLTLATTIIAACNLTPFGAAAQDAPASADNAAPPDNGANPAPQAPLTGDVIHLKSGTVMSGVQVLRGTPMYYEVQIVEGVEPMQIPRRQVDHIDYDNIDPLHEQLKEEIMGPSEEQVTIASGEQVTSDLRDKLMAPVAETPLKYENKDLVEILDELKQRLGVDLRVDASVKQLPPAQRRWTIDIPADKTLMALLREDLVSKFKFAEVVFESDHIIVMTKKAAKERQQSRQQAPATTP